MANSKKRHRIDAAATPVAAVAACLKRHVLSGHRLVIGLSGGIDSATLLHILVKGGLVRERGGELSALHVHHGISPHADAWESFCRQYCARLGIPFISKRVAVPRKTRDGLEAAARRVRHAVLADTDADWILLAHHRDDQAETVLFNLIRGTGVAGAAAMRERNGRILRPLLCVGRKEIECYAREHGLQWIEDESNADVRHSRNYLRQRIFPELEKRFPAVAKNLAAAALRFAETLELLDDLARNDLGRDADFPIASEAFAALGELHARNLLRFLLARHGVQIPSEARLREVVRQMRTAAGDRHPSVVLGAYRLVRRHERIYLEPNLSSSDKRWQSPC